MLSYSPYTNSSIYLHYRYDWYELGNVKNMDGKKVFPYAVSLGWTRKKWMGEDNVPPDSECKMFDQLNKREQDAAIGMGWLQETWDSHPCSVSLNMVY